VVIYTHQVSSPTRQGRSVTAERRMASNQSLQADDHLGRVDPPVLAAERLVVRPT
jgi:hypothetical protein